MTYFILFVAFVVVIAVVASASAKDEPAAAAANPSASAKQEPAAAAASPSASAKQERAGYMARLEQHLRESDVETARIKKTIPNSTSLETVEAAIRDYERLLVAVKAARQELSPGFKRFLSEHEDGRRNLELSWADGSSPKIKQNRPDAKAAHWLRAIMAAAHG